MVLPWSSLWFESWQWLELSLFRFQMEQSCPSLKLELMVSAAPLLVPMWWKFQVPILYQCHIFKKRTGCTFWWCIFAIECMHGTWRHEPFPEVLRGGSATWAFKEYGPGGCLGAGRRCYIGSHTHILAHSYRAIISHFDLWARTIACRYPSPRVAIHHI